jgi:hypothetical protein
MTDVTLIHTDDRGYPLPSRIPARSQFGTAMS